MPKIKAAVFMTALSVWVHAHAAGQTSPIVTSTDTVEALLQAENKSIMNRANPASQSATAPAAAAQEVIVKKEIVLLSVYGFSSDLRVDVKYGDSVFVGLVAGQKVGPLQVVSIEGVCAQLLVESQLRQQPTRYCWSLSSPTSKATPPARPELVQNPPLPSGMGLPSLPTLPGMSGLLGLARGVSGDKSTR
jgi:hypothetical protein